MYTFKLSLRQGSNSKIIEHVVTKATILLFFTLISILRLSFSLFYPGSFSFNNSHEICPQIQERQYGAFVLALSTLFIPGFFLASEVDRWLFLCAHWTNAEERLFVTPENFSVIFNKHDIVRLSDQQVEQCDQAWRFFERIQRLELTPLECVVVTCLGLLTNGK